MEEWKHYYSKEKVQKLYGVVSYKASHATATIWCLVLPTWVQTISDSSTRVLCSGLQQRRLVGKREETAPEMAAEFFLSVSYLKGTSKYRKILRHGANGFTSPSKNVVLRTFFAFKIHRSRPGLNPPTLGPVQAR
jgi:hypothetical protein